MMSESLDCRERLGDHARIVLDRAPEHDVPTSAVSADEPADAEALFVQFVRHRDERCPRCDYSLRNAVHPVCPECGEPLRLAVGAMHPIIGALLVTVAPALGCGVCAVIFLTLIMVAPGAPFAIFLATGLMLVSGIGALILIARRRTFLRQSREAQRAWSIASLIVHAVLIAFLVFALVYGR